MNEQCKVIAFPLAARVGKIRRCAEVLQNSVTQTIRDAYWRKTVGHLRDKLEDLGLVDAEINFQIRQFRTEVQKEYLRRYCVVMQQGAAPDGAA